MKYINAFFLIIFLTACSIPSPLVVSPVNGTQPPTIAQGQRPANTVTPEFQPQDVQCAYMEGRQQLPDISAKLTSNLSETDLEIKSARAEAYGENCFGSDGNLVRFSARETDFYITIAVQNLEDETALGNALEKIIASVEQFAVGTTPGPNPGYIGINFEALEEVKNLWFPRTKAVDLIASKISGADLYRSLANNP